MVFWKIQTFRLFCKQGRKLFRTIFYSCRIICQIFCPPDDFPIIFLSQFAKTFFSEHCVPKIMWRIFGTLPFLFRKTIQWRRISRGQINPFHLGIPISSQNFSVILSKKIRRKIILSTLSFCCRKTIRWHRYIIKRPDFPVSSGDSDSSPLHFYQKGPSPKQKTRPLS